MDKSDFWYQIKYPDTTGFKIKVEAKDLFVNKLRRTLLYDAALTIIKQKGVKQKPIKEALDWFFYEDKTIPPSHKLSIESIRYCAATQTIRIKAEENEKIFQKRNYIAENVGWYFHVLGVKIRPSILCRRVDAIPKRFTTERLPWDFSSNCAMELIPIASGPDTNSFLLSIGLRNIVLDAGFTLIESLKEGLEKGENKEVDAIFVSHAHRDHDKGLPILIENFPKTPIILSQTTLDFFLLRMGFEKRPFPPWVETLIKNSLIVKHLDKIAVGDRGDFLQFFLAGHLPGALMFYAEINNLHFLYTGDYTFFDYSPIQGLSSQKDILPKSVDFALVDGRFAYKTFHAPKYQFDFLRDNAKLKAKTRNKFLIGADPAGAAIVIFVTLHNFFVREKEKGLERPTIYMNWKVYKYVQILCTRLQDLHAETGNLIKRELNPFSSAIVKWIDRPSKTDDLIKLLSEKDSGGILVIYDPADLGTGSILEFYKAISSNPDNAVYLAGPLRNLAAKDLVDGKDDITLFSESGEIPWKNEAQILNRVDPENILKLHADEYQLRNLIETIHPTHVCLFHDFPRRLKPVCEWILKDYPFVKKTHAISMAVNEKYHIEN